MSDSTEPNDAEGAPPSDDHQWQDAQPHSDDALEAPRGENMGAAPAAIVDVPEAYPANEYDEDAEAAEELASTEHAYAELSWGRPSQPSPAWDAAPEYGAASEVADRPDPMSAEADYAELSVTTYTPPAPPPEPRVSGVELRRRLRETYVQADNDEAPAKAQGGLISRMFAKR